MDWIPTKHLSLLWVVSTVQACASHPPVETGIAAGRKSSVELVVQSIDRIPDFSGYWNGGNVAPVSTETEVTFSVRARDGDLANFERDFAVLERAHVNKPIYRPEFWEVIQDMDWNGLTRDPVFNCLPPGLPRIGPPDKIVQTPKEILFFYERTGTFRTIHLDGRDHSPLQIADTSWYGYSIGRWDGVTLVIETVGFNDQSWLGWAGYIHSWDMSVTERVSVDGNSLRWVATVNDPMLLKPWTMDAVIRTRNPNPEAFLWEAPPCEERDADGILDRNVRG